MDDKIFRIEQLWPVPEENAGLCGFSRRCAIYIIIRFLMPTGSMMELSKKHLGEVDYLRVFGLITIVVIHSLAFFFSLPGDGSPGKSLQGLAVNLLRYGRFVFVFVTGLVLFYSYKDRALNPGRFFKRRLNNLVIPYAVWTAVYLIISRGSDLVNWSGLGGFIVLWLKNLLSGNGFYHLYYIVVTLQFYILLPLLLLVFKPRRRRLWAGAILAAGLVFCVFYHYILEIRGQEIINLAAGTSWAGFIDWLQRYKDRLLIAYLPFYLLGGLAGLYLEECRRWLTDHRRLIGIGVLFSAAVVSGEYFYFHRYLGQSFTLTISVFKPSIFLYSLSVIAMLFLLSLAMERRGVLHWLTGVLSANSLGIYLMHPFVLYLLHAYYYVGGFGVIPRYVLMVIDPLAAIAVSCLINLILGSNRYTRFITGKAGNIRLQQLFHGLSVYRNGYRRAH